MNILYIYGLDSKLSPEKRTILEKFGNVFTPDIDYYSDTEAINSIMAQMKGIEINVVIGSSMGGFSGYYISTHLAVPALLFNPALEKRSIEQEVPDKIIDEKTRKKFILGAIDDVIDPGDTLRFLSRNFNEHTDFHIHIVPELTHNIPVSIFEEVVKEFFNSYFDE
jgi:uncharacterized protein